jgi:pyruvate ferredoxin oxidoreductase gamma subunit
VYRIRIHARGGQGAKTASRILGSAFFAEGYEVQDAPHYGAERRGAPIVATVRAAHAPILERGAIERPDLVVVADATLIHVASSGVLGGVSERTVLLIHSEEDADTWRRRLGRVGLVLTLEPHVGAARELHFVGARCAGAAARMTGAVSRDALGEALRLELGALGAAAVAENLELALDAYDAFARHEGCVTEAPDAPLPARATTDWVDLPFEGADSAAPDIHGSLTSVRVRTGLWRTLRPVIDLDHCHRCHWVCSTLCPDGAIAVLADGAPEIDYDHCKGCMICVAVCPTHAIRCVSEADARRQEEARP